ncbi:hypothetical protein ACFL4T_10290 [candidate division KSB1 bacterium]
MNKLNYILVIALFLLFSTCTKESSPSFNETEKEEIADAIKALTILSKIDTTRIQFLDDSLLQMLSKVEGFEEYLTNISKDSLISIEDFLQIYRKINKELNTRQRSENPAKDR